MERIPKAVTDKPFTIHFIKGLNNIVTLDIDSDIVSEIRVRADINKLPLSFDFIEPEKYDMLAFESGDKILTELTGINYTGANTHLVSSRPLIGYAYNKVYDTQKVGAADNDRCVILQSRDIFATPWTHRSKIYKSHGNQKADILPMSLAGMNIKCFFGSCAMSYPKTIKVDSFQFDHLNAIQINMRQAWITRTGGLTYNKPGIYVSSVKMPEVVIDYTLLFTEYLQSLPAFTNNWIRDMKVSAVSQMSSTAINNYIESTVLPLYNLKESDYTIKFYAVSSPVIRPPQAWKRDTVLCKTKDDLRLYRKVEEISPNSANIQYSPHVIGTYQFDYLDGIYMEITFNKF